MTDPELTALFHSWWSQSCPIRPSDRDRTSHLEWGRYLLDHQREQEQQQRDVDA